MKRLSIFPAVLSRGLERGRSTSVLPLCSPTLSLTMSRICPSPPLPVPPLQISDLVELLDQISLLFPNLNFLSFMRNPASAPLVCVGQSDVEASRRYRVYTCFRLPKLQMLDSSMVTPEERKQAAEGGKYLAVRKPKKPAPAGSAGGAPGEAEGTSAAGSAGSAGAGAGAGATGGADKLFFGSGDAGAAAAAAAGAAAAAEGEKRGGAYLGLGTTHYDGRHSEGNRFIVDRDL